MRHKHAPVTLFQHRESDRNALIIRVFEKLDIN